MKTAQKLLSMLGICSATQRHINLINDFILTGSEKVENLLNELGEWDADDLSKAKEWMKLPTRSS